MHCPSCQAPSTYFIENPSEGSTVCTKCGLVVAQDRLEDSAYNPHWQRGSQVADVHLGFNIGQRLELTPVPPLNGEEQVTDASSSHPSTGKVTGKRAARRARAELHPYTVARRKAEIMRIMAYIKRIADCLNAPGLVDRCHFLFNLAVSSTDLRLGRAGEILAGACLLVAARENARPIPMENISSLVGVTRFELGRTLRKLQPLVPTQALTGDREFITQCIDSVYTHMGRLYQEISDADPTKTKPSSDQLFHSSHRARIIEVAHRLWDFVKAANATGGCRPSGWYGAITLMALEQYTHEHALTVSTPPGMTEAVPTGSPTNPIFIGEPGDIHGLREIVSQSVQMEKQSRITLSSRYGELQKLIHFYARYLPWAAGQLTTRQAYRFARDVAVHHQAISDKITSGIDPVEANSPEVDEQTDQPSSTSEPDADVSSSQSNIPPVKASAVFSRVFGPQISESLPSKKNLRYSQLAAVRQQLSQPDPTTSLDEEQIVLQRLILAGVPDSVLRTASREYLDSLVTTIATHLPPCQIGQDTYVYADQPDPDIPLWPLDQQVRDLLSGCPFCGGWHGYRVGRPHSENSPHSNETTTGDQTADGISEIEIDNYLKKTPSPLHN
ncbi:hypothetical protein BJ085DRAFT_39425 [Dimargaris cristalligena]|uniref:TFIIB-type domain-containing protein n=1 Tax=Dimargaris cristalligena TaxID=215637 RepID=A0A4Q0A088_9FUNG|nr:hypothetical protein BJ085DRAFT_39425 [Dimargaris cristalligena]|eukprot:RKP39128.1 hypothetical protein BJ085DRAFT_39425 [Dimargaris cristalligena]